MWVHLLILSHCRGCIYIYSIKCCGALLAWPDQGGATSVLPVSGCTSADADVIHWIQVAAVWLWDAVCLGVVGATHGCAMGTMGTCWSATEVDGVVMDCPATSTLECMSGLTASGWCSWMWSHPHLYSALPSTNEFVDVGAMIYCTYYSGRAPQCPVIVDYRNRLSCVGWGFPAATCKVMVSCMLGCTSL